MDETTRAYRLRQWAEAISNRNQSGLTISEWCEKNGVSKYQYYYRLRAVRKAAAAQLEPANTDSHPIFALLDPTACQGQSAPHDTVSETSISSKVNVCIRLNGAEILIADPVSGDLLNKVIKAVRSC